MSFYTSEEEKIILKDNDEITNINLARNRNLKVLIIDNLPNLEKLSIIINEGLYVSICNCVSLIGIMTVNRDINFSECGSYFYLGENLKSLTNITLTKFKTVKFADQIFDELENANFNFIERLICDFKNFSILRQLEMLKVNTSNLIFDSESVVYFTITCCKIDNIEILGKCNMNNFKFSNSEYKSLKIENPIKTDILNLYDKDYAKVFPYIQLSDEIDKTLKFYINLDNIYDSQYKFFIERNSSKIEIYNYSSKEKLTLDDVKFNIPQKKSAR